MHCVQCGKETVEGARFCGHCGAALPDFVGAPAAAAAPVTPRSPSAFADPLVSQTRPWVRYWARMFDVSLFYVLALILRIVTGYPPRTYDGNSYIGFFMFALFVWVFVESLLLSTIGTTPGKWIMKVSLTEHDGTKLSYSHAVSRSIGVWGGGLGIGIPIISAITLLISRHSLVKNGVAPWDKIGSFFVRHAKIGALRGTLFALAYIILFLLCYIGNTVTA